MPSEASLNGNRPAEAAAGIVQELLLSGVGMSVADMRRMARWGGRTLSPETARSDRLRRGRHKAGAPEGAAQGQGGRGGARMVLDPS